MSMAEHPGAPPAWDYDVLLSDGSIARLRTPGPEDLDAAIAFFDRLSPESRYSRFFSHHRPTEAEVRRYALGDHERTIALFAEADGEILGVSSYVTSQNGSSAEVAFAVADVHHHRGIATLMLEHMAAMARRSGVLRFTATTMADNGAMLDVFHRSGFERHRALDTDVVELELGLDADPARHEVVAERERIAEARSIGATLAPRVVAVIGASNTEGTVGHALFRNILIGGFAGSAFPVNPGATSIQGVRAYPSVLDVPDEIDLAVIAVPAAVVSECLAECGRAGVHAAVIISAGFAESSAAGTTAEAELVEIARRHGMRIVGPNCIGISNSNPDVQLDATFSPVEPVQGTVGFASQSGAMGIAALAEAHRRGIGISTFVSLGNKADVSGNDLLQYWETDPDTDVATLYLESFGNPRKFSRIARRFCRTKPLVVMKSGRTDPGRRGASSHTAAMSSDDDLATALFAEAGIIRVDTMSEMFDVTRLLVHQPLPAGPRVAIVGNSGGPGILAADACVAAGLTVPELGAGTQEGLAALLPGGAGVSNPVDLIAGAGAATYEAALRLVLDDDAVDAVIVIYTDPMISEASDISAAVRQAVSAGPPKAVAACFLAADVGPVIEVSGPGGAPRTVPVYDFPEEAAVALGHASWLQGWRAQPAGSVPELTGVDQVAAAEIVNDAIDAAGDGGTWLTPDQTAAVLRAYGIEPIPATVVASAEEAASAVEGFGVPVAIKVVGPTIVHKTDVGGVRLDVAGGGAAAEVFVDFASRFGEAMTGAVVQPMAQKGNEVIVGLLQEPTFGPVLMVGTGGVTAELWADRAHALVPLTRERAAALIDRPRGSALLHGYRGAPPSDIEALRDVVLRLSALGGDLPTIAELDLNPVMVGPHGCQIVDARCRVARPVAPAELNVRHLRRGGPR